MPYSQRLDGDDYALLISAIEFTSLKFIHDQEYLQETYSIRSTHHFNIQVNLDLLHL